MNGAYPLFACMGHLGKGELEKRLDRNWWKYLFSSTYDETSLYLKTDGDVVEDPDITSAEVDVFTKAGKLTVEDEVLDLCCGQGRHSLELARRGHQKITGIDYSQLLISTAQQRAAERGLDRIKFIQGEASHLPFPEAQFDVVLCLGNSFGYFQSVNDDLGVLMEIARVLKKGGRLVLDLADGDYLRSNFQPRSWEWVDNSMFVVRERELASDGRLISREIITLTDKGVIKDQIYSERLFNFEAISHLFKQVGLTQPELFKELGTDSKRDQDLGMMEQRLVITGTLTDPDARIRMFSANPSLSIIPSVIVYPSEVVELQQEGKKVKGLMAKRNMSAGEVVEQFVGQMVRFGEIPDEEIPFVVWVGPDLWMITQGNARHVNHSCDPNCGLNPDRAIVTRRPVKEGEELCISYNVSTEDGDWDPRWTFRCECESHNCQGLIDRYVDLNGRPFTPKHKTPPAPK